jgi:hypothetical protein
MGKSIMFHLCRKNLIVHYVENYFIKSLMEENNFYFNNLKIYKNLIIDQLFNLWYYLGIALSIGNHFFAIKLSILLFNLFYLQLSTMLQFVDYLFTVFIQ